MAEKIHTSKVALEGERKQVNDLHLDYSAVGLTRVLAARMEQLVTPGSILLTAATLRLVEGLVQVTLEPARPNARARPTRSRSAC